MSRLVTFLCGIGVGAAIAAGAVIWWAVSGTVREADRMDRDRAHR